MPRKRVDSIRLFGRLSENNMTEEELEFVKKQLENQSNSQFVRQAVKIYYMYSEGKIFNEVVEKLKELGIERISQLEDDESYEELNDVIDSDFFK